MFERHFDVRLTVNKVFGFGRKKNHSLINTYVGEDAPNLFEIQIKKRAKQHLRLNGLRVGHKKRLLNCDI